MFVALLSKIIELWYNCRTCCLPKIKATKSLLWVPRQTYILHYTTIPYYTVSDIDEMGFYWLRHATHVGVGYCVIVIWGDSLKGIANGVERWRRKRKNNKLN